MSDGELLRNNQGVVQRRPVRRDGWSKRARQTFLDTLAATCNVRMAARAAGKNPTGAYALRKRDPAFHAAWAEALAIGVEQLENALLEHAMHAIMPVNLDRPIVIEGTLQASDGAAPVKLDIALVKLALGQHRGAAQDGGKGMQTTREATREEVEAALARLLDKVARKTGDVPPVSGA